MTRIGLANLVEVVPLDLNEWIKQEAEDVLYSAKCDPQQNLYFDNGKYYVLPEQVSYLSNLNLVLVVPE